MFEYLIGGNYRRCLYGRGRLSCENTRSRIPSGHHGAWPVTSERKIQVEASTGHTAQAAHRTSHGLASSPNGFPSASIIRERNNFYHASLISKEVTQLYAYYNGTNVDVHLSSIIARKNRGSPRRTNVAPSYVRDVLLSIIINFIVYRNLYCNFAKDTAATSLRVTAGLRNSLLSAQARAVPAWWVWRCRVTASSATRWTPPRGWSPPARHGVSIWARRRGIDWRRSADTTSNTAGPPMSRVKARCRPTGC